MMDTLFFLQAHGPLGPPPNVQTFYTLGAAGFVAMIACFSRTVQKNRGVMPPPLEFAAEMGMGLLAGVLLPLFIGDVKPIGFGTAVTLGGIGGAFGFAAIKALANVFLGRWGVRIETDEATKGGSDDNSTDIQSADSAQEAEGGQREEH